MNEKKELDCAKDELIVCPTCKMSVDKKHLGERCPRCNTIILPKSCEECKNICK